VRTASRVFLWLGVFGLIATLIFAAGSRFRYDNLQGVVVLGAFFLACVYLSRLMRGPGSLEIDGLKLPGAGEHEDEEIHLPGPSWWPAAYGVAGFVLVLGLVMNRTMLLVGIALIVLTTIGWALESVKEYRREIAHHKPVALPHPDAIELAQHVLAFRRDHGGADAVVQHVGRGAGEVVLVGRDGAWGNLLARDVAMAREACALADTELHTAWPSGLGARVVTGPDQWQAMGGDRTFSGGDGHEAPRDGTTQVAGRVFLWLAFFAILADVLFAVASKFRFDNLQGVVILTAFAVACYYLHLGLKNAKARPEDAAYVGDDHVTIEPAEPDPPVDLETLHLPGPSWWPAFFSVAGLVLVLGLVFHSGVTIASGIVLLVVCCVGWGIQSVHEYRQAISGQHHGTQDALHPAPSPLSH
jgi:hypothetical protein